MDPHPTNFPPHPGPRSAPPAYENQPPPRCRPPTIPEENTDAPHQVHHHNIMHPVFTTMPATQQGVLNSAHYPLHQSPDHAYQGQGVTLPAAVAQQDTPYRHRGDEERMHHDASPHAFSPPGGSHPQPPLRSWYSQDSSYTQESLRQVQLDAAARDKGSKRRVIPSDSLPPNFGSMKLQNDDSDEEGVVTREIREKAGEIMEETSSNRTIKTDIQKPFDPNLVCPTCNRQFRIFEIQKFKRHANECGVK